MRVAGLSALPFIGPDGIEDPAFIENVGAAAANSYSTVEVIGDFPSKPDFTSRYRARFKEDPGTYSAAAYACGEVILESLVASTETDPAKVREQVRAYAVDPAHTFATLLGDESFDENGDTTHQIISIYKVDMTAQGGKGNWVFDQQVDYATK